MKHGSNNRRGRSRGNNRRSGPNKNTTFESNGPNAKVRGTAQQIQEKYTQLARDASSSGDRILAEGYMQFAEHYYRVASSIAEQQQAGRNKDRPRADGEQDGKETATEDTKGEASDGDDADGEKAENDQQAEAQPKRGRRRQARPRDGEAAEEAEAEAGAA